MLMRIMPLFFAFISFTLPSGIVVYFLVSNLFRVGQQAFITRTLYRDDDGPVATTGRESDKSSKKSSAPADKPKGLFAQLKEIEPPNPGRAKREVAASKASGGSNAKGSKSTSTTTSKGSSSTSGPSRSAPSAANRSKSKKKRK
jgi:hypothetical protein